MTRRNRKTTTLLKHKRLTRHARRRAPDSRSKLQKFAERVKKVGEKIASGPSRDTATFGGYKVFIHAVWSVGKFKDTLGEFKQKLVEAQRAGLVELARADLVSAMNPYDVKRSNTENGNATYNFVVLDYKKFS